MNKRIVVPEGMLRAALSVIKGSLSDVPPVAIDAALHEALRWLSENPIVPSSEQSADAYAYTFSTSLLPLYAPFREIPHWVFVGIVSEWQRRMFLAVDEDEPIRDLLQPQWVNALDDKIDNHDRCVREAYRRGLKR